MDTWAGGRRYLSLAALCLTRREAVQLRQVTGRFAGLLDRAVDGILDDSDWWSSLAWPWPAIELARQEPPHPGRLASLFGRHCRQLWQGKFFAPAHRVSLLFEMGVVSRGADRRFL